MPARGRPRISPAGEPAKSVRSRKPPAPAALGDDSFGETRLLVAAILRARGGQGATPEMLHRVVAWARSVRAETELLHGLAARQRRPKNGTEPDRLLTNEMNRALLEGVLDGSIAIRVADDGGFSFAADGGGRLEEISLGALTDISKGEAPA